MLFNIGFNDGIPIDEAFFQKHISGRHNPEIAKDVGMSAPRHLAAVWNRKQCNWGLVCHLNMASGQKPMKNRLFEASGSQ
jgi:hypothetical protein